MASLGVSFARAIAAKDRNAVRALLAPDVDFRGMTPRKFWEADDVEAVIAVLFDNWFEDQDVIDDVLEVTDADPVEDTDLVSYRFALSTPDGPHVAAQQAYYRASGDQIDYLRIMCSGFRPTT